jgi:hypothetical protein
VVKIEDLPWAALAVGTTGSLAANNATAGPGNVSRVIAGWRALARAADRGQAAVRRAGPARRIRARPLLAQPEPILGVAPGRPAGQE